MSAALSSHGKIHRLAAVVALTPAFGSAELFKDPLQKGFRQPPCSAKPQVFWPWIKPEQSMQFVTFSEVVVSGPSRFNGKLPQPAAQRKFYRDIAVWAFPPVAQRTRGPITSARRRCPTIPRIPSSRAARIGYTNA